MNQNRPNANSQCSSTWQDISGIYPEMEFHMDRQEREDGIRKLVACAQAIAKQEFERAPNVPQGERTFLYDPLDHICNVLRISRTRLSSYVKELTGMRAHEMTDRIKAASLPQVLTQRLRDMLEKGAESLKASIRGQLDPTDSDESPADAMRRCVQLLLKQFREERRDFPESWAMKMGYASMRRLKSACKLAHEMTLDELEKRLLTRLLQEIREGAGDRGQGSEKKTQEENDVQKLPNERQTALEALKTELGLSGELTSEDRKLLEAMLDERAA